MDVHLFCVGGSSCEVAAERSSVDEQVTRNDTDVLPLGKHVETGGLSGARRTHEGSHGSRFDISVDLVKESESPAGDGDGVIDVFPGEGLVISERGPIRTNSVGHDKHGNDQNQPLFRSDLFVLDLPRSSLFLTLRLIELRRFFSVFYVERNT